MRDRTTIVIAHRPATIALADRVVLLEHGRIVAEGTHQRLLATSADYREVLAVGRAQRGGGRRCGVTPGSTRPTSSTASRRAPF